MWKFSGLAAGMTTLTVRGALLGSLQLGDCAGAVAATKASLKLLVPPAAVQVEVAATAGAASATSMVREKRANRTVAVSDDKWVINGLLNGFWDATVR